LPRPAKKRAYWEAKCAEKGRLQARLEMHKKKPLDESAKEHIGKILDNLHIGEISELIAIIGAANIIFDLIMSVEAWRTKAQKSPIGYAIIGSAYQQSGLFETVPKELIDKLTKDQISVFLTSWTIAYIIIKHGGQLIGLLEKGLTTVIPMFLGLL
jgi:hypothetical protein